MIKKSILILIMLISTLGIYSFTNSGGDTKTSIASYYHDQIYGRMRPDRYFSLFAS